MHVQDKRVSQRSVDISLRLMNGANPKYTYYLEYLLLHFPHERALYGLEWLYRKGVRGKLLEEFCEVMCHGSALTFCKQVFRGAERDAEVKPIFAADLRA